LRINWVSAVQPSLNVCTAFASAASIADVYPAVCVVRSGQQRWRCGGDTKIRLITDNIANVVDRKTNKYMKANIEMVLENPANRNYVRRNIITKGTVIKTDKGNARVLSRPGQDGVINAELIQ